MDPVVELRSARKRYGDVEALRGVDLTVRAGESLAILGPNGAGKTTAIALMLGLRRATAGSARLFGLDPRDRRARSRSGAMLQESGVPAMLTVREIVDLFRAYYPAPLPADRAIGLAGLASRAAVRAGHLSGGERQRLYFALAVCGDPAVLFLYHHAQLGSSALRPGEAAPVASLVWLLGYTLVFGALALWAYQREEQRKFV